jgi:Lamin Tail Domain
VQRRRQCNESTVSSRGLLWLFQRVNVRGQKMNATCLTPDKSLRLALVVRPISLVERCTSVISLLWPSSGAIFISEIASTGNALICAGADYIELYNSDPTPADVSGYKLTDPGATFIIPTTTTIPAGGYITYCQNLAGSFTFGISGVDTITLKFPNDVVSFVTTLNGQGSSTNKFQLLPDGSYGQGFPTPNAAAAAPAAVVNEVAPAGSTNTTFCGGAPFIEIINTGAGTVNLSGYVVYNATGASYTLPPNATAPYGSFPVLCQGTNFLFDIASNDRISLNNTAGQTVSTTGVIGGASPRPKAVNLVWVRVTDLINTTNPDPPFYQYSTSPTPGRSNVFPFTPAANVTTQSCGIQTAPLPCLADYEWKEYLLFNVPFNPELSGGALDGSTCNHLMVSDEGIIFEISLSGPTPQLIRSIPIFGGSRDIEGICYYSPGKVAIVDERERSGTCTDVSHNVSSPMSNFTHFLLYFSTTLTPSRALRFSSSWAEDTTVSRQQQLSRYGTDCCTDSANKCRPESRI